MHPTPSPAEPFRGGLTHLEGTLASADGTELFVRSVRPLQPQAVVAIVHGYGDHSGCYIELMDYLAAAGFEAHAMDLRGHGRSAGRRGAIRRWTEYLDDLTAFVERVRRSAVGGGGLAGDVRPLFLLGQSHGALLLVHAALAGRVEASGMILTSPYFRFVLPVPRWKLALGRVADRALPWLSLRSELRPEMMTADPAVLEAARADPLTLRVASPRWFFAATKIQAQVLARAPDFRLPVLIIQGEADPITDPAATRLFVERIGSEDKTYLTFPTMRHETHRELNREAVWEAIITWLRPCTRT